MSRQIDRVAVEDQLGRLELSCRMGINALQPITIACVVICLVIAVAGIFLFPENWNGIYPFVPAFLAAIYLLAAMLANRTHITVTPGGVEWGTRPIPVPNHALGRWLRTDQVAAIFVSPMAIPGKYTATYFHFYDVLILSTSGNADRLVARLPSLPAARELAALIESRLNRVAPQTMPRLSAEMRTTCDDDAPIPAGWPITLFCSGVLLAGFLIVTAPFWRTLGKTETVAKVYEVGWVTRMGAKRNYQQQVCYVDFQTPSGPRNARFEENCPKSVKRGDVMTLYYDDQSTYVRSFGKALFGLIFVLPGLGGLIYLAVKRMRAPAAPLPGHPHVLLEDKFGWLDWCWDLQKRNASAGKSVLELNAAPGTTITPFLCRAAFASPTIDLQVRAQYADIPKQAAGILFWADGLGNGYAFAVWPIEGIVDCWRLLSGKWETVTTPIRLPNVPPGAAWTALRVVTRDAAADFYANGVQLATIEGQPPPGGSFAGLVGIFPAETNASFQFTGFRVSIDR